MSNAKVRHRRRRRDERRYARLNHGVKYVIRVLDQVVKSLEVLRSLSREFVGQANDDELRRRLVLKASAIVRFELWKAENAPMRALSLAWFRRAAP